MNKIMNLTSNGNRVAVLDSKGHLSPVHLTIKDLTLQSYQYTSGRYIDGVGVIHNANTITKTTHALGKEQYNRLCTFLNHEESDYEVAPAYITTPDNKATVAMANELLPMLFDGFGGCWPRTPGFNDFIDVFSNRVLTYALNKYSLDDRDDGEDPLYELHNDLQPLWSDAMVYPISGYIVPNTNNTEKGYSWTHHYIYQDIYGVWSIASDLNKLAENGTIIACSNILVISQVLETNPLRNLMQAQESNLFGFEITRYTKS